MPQTLFRSFVASLRILVLLLLPCLPAGCGMQPWLQWGWSDPPFYFTGEAMPPNLHVLDPGKAYRSGQPEGRELKNAINLLGLKTVLNLHGTEPGESWYDQEVVTCHQMNVTFADYPMDPGSLPPPDTLKGIVNTLKTAQYPILIHCAAGMDRTGAVSSIYRILITGEDKPTALGQMGRSKAEWMHALAQMYQPTDEWLATYAQQYDNLTPSAGP